MQEVVNSYFLKLSDREEGPYSEEQVSHLFADGRVDRGTPCRLGAGGAWKTIDDLLPILKYGTQLPNPTSPPVVLSEASPVFGAGPARSPQSRLPADARVSVVDLDLPFLSILKLLFKWAAAGIIVGLCLTPIILLLAFILMAVFGALLGGLFSGLHHP